METCDILNKMPHLKRLSVDIVWKSWVGSARIPRESAEASDLDRYMKSILLREKSFLYPLSAVWKKVPLRLFLNWPGSSHEDWMPSGTLQRRSAYLEQGRSVVMQ
jgi:hypothetical protein